MTSPFTATALELLRGRHPDGQDREAVATRLDAIFVDASSAFDAKADGPRGSNRRATRKLSEEAFAAALVARLPADEDVLAALGVIHSADLYLALSCAAGDEVAHEVFERHLVPEIARSLARMRLADSVIEETLQRLREELLVSAPGKKPRILDYAARGELRRWLRAVAGRTGLRVVHRTPKHVPLDDSLAVVDGRDLEIDFLRKKYGSVFREAFREALLALPADDRLLLKQRFRHHLTGDELGALHGVHASTISRRVTQARDALVTMTREAMMRRLNVGRAEVSSLLRLIQSDLDISLSVSDVESASR